MLTFFPSVSSWSHISEWAMKMNERNIFNGHNAWVRSESEICIKRSNVYKSKSIEGDIAMTYDEWKLWESWVKDRNRYNEGSKILKICLFLYHYTRQYCCHLEIPTSPPQHRPKIRFHFWESSSLRVWSGRRFTRRDWKVTLEWHANNSIWRSFLLPPPSCLVTLTISSYLLSPSTTFSLCCCWSSTQQKPAKACVWWKQKKKKVRVKSMSRSSQHVISAFLCLLARWQRFCGKLISQKVANFLYMWTIHRTHQCEPATVKTYGKLFHIHPIHHTQPSHS